LTLECPDFSELKKFLVQLQTLNNQYIEFKSNSHLLTVKEKKFQNFIKKALDKLNEPYLIQNSSSRFSYTQQSLGNENISDNLKNYANPSIVNMSVSFSKKPLLKNNSIVSLKVFNFKKIIFRIYQIRKLMNQMKKNQTSRNKIWEIWWKN
jgi:hypothetical protein